MPITTLLAVRAIAAPVVHLDGTTPAAHVRGATAAPGMADGADA